ncbi:carbohydrate ABC transporter permease [Paenibacillus thermotolerans]|uniref:carbohydrate ABC transporter permease n=1 Tax=Paenibacillus thermotolerans TaxID=3027807 RepID=UPI00236861C8|nr:MULTISPECIES: carbohydrate ABC transporter permease [unclassified Paenibacillus]
MKLEETVRQIKLEVSSALSGRKAQQLKRFALGQNLNDGWVAKVIILLLLTVIAFLYIKPIIYMVSTSMKSLADLIDPVVGIIPRNVNAQNFIDAWNGLVYPQSFASTLTIALFGSLFQVVSCSITGYALARLTFPGKNVFFFLTIVTFLIPPQITIVPLYMIFQKLGWLHTPFVFLVPALLGQGVRGALFVIIFRQFFLSQPKALEEAAKMDGASVFRLFFRIMLPLAGASCLVVFLFSFIWYWNMYYEATLFLSKGFTPLSIRLNALEMQLIGNQALTFGADAGKDPIAEGPKMAAAFLIILPPLIVYMFAQRWFTEGIERTGMVE